MLFFTNILTLINADAAQTATIKSKIENLHLPFEVNENSFFFGTENIEDSKDFEKEIALLPINYTFLFIFNPDGAFLKTKGIDAAVATHMEAILHEDI